MNKLIYLLAGILTFLGFLLVMAPASIVLSFADDTLKQVPDLEIGRVDGRIWTGSAQIQYRRLPALVSWDLAALPLLAGRISAQVNVAGDGLDADFRVSANSEGGTISKGKAFIDASYINQVSLDYGLDLSGRFSLVAEEISFNKRWLTSLSGHFDWPGGIVHIETPQQLHSVDLPELNGSLTMQGDNLEIVIEGSEARMINLTLKPDGWAEVGVSFAFMDLAGLPIPGSDNSRTEPAILLEEKIL